MDFVGLKKTFESERLIVRTMEERDATERYANWLNDPEVHKFLETKSATVDEVLAYIIEKDQKPDALFCGIFLKEDDKHIGTVKLEPIEPEKNRATIAIMLGDKDEWGKGYAAEAMQLLIDWCFEELGYEAMDLGVIGDNASAIRAYEKLGFRETKRRPGAVKYGEEVYDHVLMELKRPR